MDGYGTCQDRTFLFPNKGLKPFCGAWLILWEALGSLRVGTPSPLSAPSLRDFQHGFFSPAFSTAALRVLCMQPGPHPSALLKLPAGWQVSISFLSSITWGSMAVANRSPRLGAGPCPGRFPVSPSPPGCRATSLWHSHAAIIPFTLAKPIPQHLVPSSHVCCPTGPDCP